MFKHFSGIIQPQRRLGDIVPLAGTQTQHVLESGQTLVRPDVTKAPRFKGDQALLQMGMRSTMMAPLVSKGKIIGTLSLRSRRIAAYGPANQRILERLARQIAPAIENAELHSQLKRTFEEQTVIDEVARIVTSTLDIEQVFGRFSQEVKKLLDFDRMVVHEIDTEAGVFAVRHVFGAVQPRRGKGDVRPLAGTFTQLMLDTGGSVIQDDMANQPDLGANGHLLKLGMRSAIRVPLLHEGNIIGALGLHSKHRGAFGEREQDVLQRLASLIAPAVANANYYQRLRNSIQEQEVTDEVARIVTSTLEIDRVYEEFARELKKLVDFDRIAINITDQVSGTFILKYVFGEEIPEREVGQVLPLEGSPFQEMMIARDPIIQQDVAADPRFVIDPHALDAGLLSAIKVPLISKGQVIGSLGLRSKKPAAFGPETQVVLERLARQIAPAVENARLYEEQLEVEEEVRRSGERYRELYESAPVGYASIGVDGFIRRTNKHFRQLFGYSGEELLDHPVTQLYAHFERSPNVGRSILRRFRKGPPVQNQRAQMKRKDGTVFWASVTVMPITDEKGAILESRSIVVDITKQMEEEEELRKLSRAVDQSPNSVIITDTEGNIQYVNPKFTETTGYAADEVLGRSPRILQSSETPDEVYEQQRKSLDDGGEWRGQILNRKKNGDLYWSYQFISPIKDAEGLATHFLLLEEDITRRKQLEEQLVQAQKMDAVGRMAGGVAHEFNNLLTAIIGYTKIAQDKAGGEEDIGFYLEEALKASKRAADLTEQISTFSRRKVVKDELVNLNTLIQESAGMLRSMLGEQIQLAVHAAPEDSLFRGDPDQMQSVLVNLAANAMEAMKGVGTITLETKNLALEAELALQLSMKPGKYVVLSVTDTGPGISREAREHIFEPFFTTKEVGEGSGLGLTICHGIISQAGGSILVASQPGEGACFQVFLPVSEN